MVYLHIIYTTLMMACMADRIMGKLSESKTIVNMPSVYADWTIADVIGTSKGYQIVRLSKGTQSMVVLIDGVRYVEESNTAFVEVNMDTQTAYSALKTDSKVYTTKSSNRYSVESVGVTANEALFSVGKWTALRSTDGSKAHVFNTNDNTKSKISNYADCSIIKRDNCKNGGDDKIYCLESNDAGTEQYLIYYTMPACERLKYTARITRTFPTGTLQTISVQGQLLSVCSTSTSTLTALCQIYDLNTSLFTLDNPDKAVPIKTIDYSLTTFVTQVSKIVHVLEWGCVFYITTTTSATAWNILYKCMTDSSQGTLAASDLATPVAAVAFNIGGKTISFKASDTSLIELQFTKSEDATAPANCAKYNSEIFLCYECNQYTTLQSQGSCTEQKKSFLESKYYTATVERHYIKIDFSLKVDAMKQIVNRSIQNLDFIYFENPAVTARYNMKILKSEPTFEGKNILRVKIWPNQTTDSITSNFGIRMNGYVPTKSRRVLQTSTPRLLQTTASSDSLVELLIPPYFHASTGQQASFNLLFNHIYTLVFFVKVYLILVRPFVKSWITDHLQLWITHFVLCMQTAFLFGYNSLSLKGMANNFFLSAGQASFRFMSWDAVPGRDPENSNYYFQGGFTEASGEPAFVKEMVVFFVLYIIGFAGGILSPWKNEQLKNIRTATLLCYLPQIWYMFFTGALNMLLGNNYSLMNYFSFGFSLVVTIIVIVDCFQILIPSLRTRLDNIFGNGKQGISFAYDVLDYNTRTDKVPIWYNIEIILAILVGTILAVSFNSGTTQAALLLVVYLAPIGVYVMHFRISTNRMMTKFKLTSSIVMALFMLVALILQTKNAAVDSIVVLSIIMMSLFILAIALYLAMMLLRIIDLFCGNQAIKELLPGVQIMVDGQKKDSQSDVNNISGMRYASILDRYLQPDQSRMMNDSKNDSEVNVKILDNSINKAGSGTN